MPEVFDDLRGFVEAYAKIGEYREVLGADWDEEIHALTAFAPYITVTNPSS